MADKPKHTAADVRRAVERVRVVLEREGLLVCHDPLVPSATALIAGESIRGTWWSHAQGSLTYDALGCLDEDVAWPKLVRGKVTLVHRRLWPALLAVGVSGAPWQTDKLKNDGKWLLDRVSEKKSLRSDELELLGQRHLAPVVRIRLRQGPRPGGIGHSRIIEEALGRACGLPRRQSTFVVASCPAIDGIAFERRKRHAPHLKESVLSMTNLLRRHLSDHSAKPMRSLEFPRPRN